jgi:hypothetical protein
MIHARHTQIGAYVPTGSTTTRPVRRFISPRGPAGDSSAGPIASFDATSTVDLTQPTPAADGDQRAVLSGGSLRTGRRAGNSWRVS